jgi:hypothetical protein
MDNFKDIDEENDLLSYFGKPGYAMEIAKFDVEFAVAERLVAKGILSKSSRPEHDKSGDAYWTYWFSAWHLESLQ